MKKVAVKNYKKKNKLILIIIYTLICIIIIAAAAIFAIYPGIGDIKESNKKVRLTYEEETKQIDEIKKQYVVLENQMEDSFKNLIDQANNEYSIMITEVNNKYNEIEDSINLSYTTKFDEIKTKRNDLNVKINTEFFKNGFSTKYYQLSDELDKLWDEERNLESKKREEIREQSIQEENKKQAINEDKEEKVNDINQDKEEALENLLSKRDIEINKIKNYNNDKGTVMVSGIIKIIIGVFIILIPVFYTIKVYNKLINLLNVVKEKWSQIEVLLKRRFDLIPNILESVKGYSKHEKEALKAVTNARNKMNDATTKEEEMEASKELKEALGMILVLSEAYPNLRADTNFINLQDNLKETEDNISTVRKIYNEAVLLYKNKLEMFPSCMIAALFNFKTESFFEIEEEESNNPKISFK